MRALAARRDLTTHANDIFLNVRDGAFPKLIIAGGLAMLMTACASPPTKEYVRETTTGGCMDQITYTKTRINNVVEDVQVQGSNGVTINQQRERQVEEIVNQYRKNLGFNESCARHQVLVLTAQAQQDNELGIISSMALLHMVSQEDEGTRNSIIQALQKYNTTLEAHKDRVSLFYKKVASDEIRRRFSELQQGDGHIDVVAAAAIIGLFYQDSFKDEHKRYPELEQAFLRDVIDGELQKRGMKMSDLEQAYTKGMVRKSSCRDIVDANGVRYSNCSFQ